MQRLQRWAVYLSISMIIIGILVLIGWQFHINFLRRPVEGLAAMNPVTAILFVLCGSAVLLLRPRANDHNSQPAGKILALFILSVALIRFILPVDTFLYPVALAEDMKPGISNRMSLNTAFTFMLSAAGLLSLNYETRNKKMPGQMIALCIFFIAFISILSHLYNIKLFYGSLVHIPIAVHTATGFIFLSLAILFANPDKGTTQEVCSRFSGSFIARFLIPVSVLVPLLLGLIYLEAVRTGKFTIELGTGFFALSIIMIFLSLTWFIVVTLNKRDLQKKEADEALLKFNETLEQKIQERTETIERSEKQYRYLFKNNPMPMWVIDLENFRFLDVNEMATFQYGYSREEFLQMTAIDIRPDSDREFFLRSDHSFTNAATNYNRGIWNHIKKNGTIIQVEIIAHEILFEGRKARLILSNDVTEQRRTEERIKSSEGRFRALIENNNDIISLMDEDFRVIYRSPSAARITGWSDEELQGVEGTRNIHPDDAETAKATIKELMANPGKTVHASFRTKHRDGHYLWVEGTIINQLHDEHVKAVVFNFRDITAKVVAEQKLAGREMHFKALIENSAERISLMDENSKNIYRSPAAEKIIGKMPGDGDTRSLCHPGDLEMLEKIHRHVLQSPGVPIDFQARFKHTEGHYIWLEGTFTNLLHVKDVKAIVTNYRDITLRKEAEEKIRASEKQFRSTLDNMLEGAQIIGFDWKYIYINDSLAKHAKYKRDEMIGHTVMEKFPGIEETEIFKVYKRCFEERVSVHLENEFKFPDGTVGWFELSFQPIPEGIFILSIDITDRKNAEAAILRAEANYREIFDKASDGIYIHEIPGGRIIDTNQRAAEITGYSKEEILTIWANKFVAGSSDNNINPAFLSLQKAAGGEPQLFEWLSRKKDGSYTWLEVNLKKATIAGEERILSFFREINDRKKAQEQVEKLNAELEQKVLMRTDQLRRSNEELEAFSYSVSHDLRAPLRAIIGFSSILQEDHVSKLDDEAKRIIEVIISNTKKMGQLIDDLLTFSRMGRQNILETEVNSNAVVQEIIDGLDRKELRANKINWVVHNLPPVNADLNIIRQVWVNLISNAIKYTGKAGSPRIEIGSNLLEKEVVFFIKDNGVGFDEKYKDKLFRVFQRLHTNEEFEGTGIGLAIVEKIISKHGGRVWANGAANEGACFYFSLPVNTNKHQITKPEIP
jgi:PAS domain S-box-containing protein